MEHLKKYNHSPRRNTHAHTLVNGISKMVEMRYVYPKNNARLVNKSFLRAHTMATMAAGSGKWVSAAAVVVVVSQDTTKKERK